MFITFRLLVSHGNTYDETTVIDRNTKNSGVLETPASVDWSASQNAGACDFPCDPETPADDQSLFWRPSLQPQAVKLAPVPPESQGGTAQPVALAGLDGLDLRQADDGWHGVWHVDGVRHQFWLADALPDATAVYAVILPMDTFLELRAYAARRLWRSLTGRRPGHDFHRMPDQLRQQHILSLRALDARLYGESFRTIAEILLGFRGTKDDWLDDPRRNRSRRLVARGFEMMRGDYRLLLHYPVKVGSR